MKPVRFRTNAKVNLFLRVIGRRPDGYHEVETILHGIGLADDISISPTTNGLVDVEMVVEEAMDGLPPLEENTVYLAAQRLVERGAKHEGVRIDITKRIPIGAGLGGGSGNAAGAIVMLAESWEMGLDRAALLEIAALVGADVPYCIEGGTALATSRGEDLTSLPTSETMWFVLGISSRPLLTAHVYEAFDDRGYESDAQVAPMTMAIGAGDVEGVASLLHNDLEAAALGLRPELVAKKEAMISAGALGAVMSGSGPTIFGVARDEDHARAVARAVESEFDRVMLVHSVQACIERL
jgi:4-diphosphocytidyl-2-C-methyl-D-erythritol kinase